MKRLSVSLAMAAMAAAPCLASSGLEADTASFSYLPKIELTLRPRFEWSTATGDVRFAVRNSYLTLLGSILPQVHYGLRVDYCLSGKFQVLDAFVKIDAGKQAAVQAGQYRMPFGVESFRAPWTYYFANRSFMGKQMCNYRGVGVKGMWTPARLPLSAEFGVFNPTTIADHSIWVRTIALAGKASWSIRNTTVTAGVMLLRPDGVRINLLDGCVAWSCGRWYAAAEYMYEHYTNNAHKPSHSYVAFADYKMPVKAGFFNRLSFQGRFDGMTDHSTGYRNEDGHLVTDNPSRNRVTLGTTLSYVHKSGRFLDLRINYEQYFYHAGVTPSASDGNKAVAELVLHF